MPELTKEQDDYWAAQGVPAGYRAWFQKMRDIEVRGPGSRHSETNPNVWELPKNQLDLLRVIEQKYDQTQNVRASKFPRDTLDALESGGFIRIVNGRVIPSFIFEEHDSPDRGQFG